MADLRISDLVTASQLKDDDYYEIAQSESGTRVSYKTTLLAIAVQIATMVDFTSDLNTTSKKITGAINELKQLISLIPQFSIEVVEELPTEDISDTTIYLVPAEDPEVGNYYEEYIYVNNTWELVGTTAVDLSAYYTKLEVDGLLATKASVADVALKENKSDMPTDVRTIIKDCKTPKSATITNGIAKFDCIEENLVKGLKVSMSPIQSGTGDPSPTNIRPISGRTGVELEQMGKNLIVDSIASCSISSAGNLVSSTYTTYIIKTKKGARYIASANGETVASYWGEFSTAPAMGSQSISASRYSGNSLTATIDGYIAVAFPSGSTNPMIELGQTITTYEAPITPITHTHTYSSTVYGGVDDFVNGGATSTYKMVDMGSIEWGYDTGYTYPFFKAKLDIPTPSAGYDYGICSQYEVLPARSGSKFRTTDYDGKASWVYDQGNYNFAIQDSRYTNLSDFIAAMSGVQLCYELETPITISTSAEEITTVAGTNIISGTEPISECKYTELATVDDLRKIIGGQ